MIKVDVVSGFLGSGKTTLIKQLAKVMTEQGERIAIIENEFGEAGIDGKILKSSDFFVYEISKGCLCCSLKGDFVSTLLKIAAEYNPERIIIEPSGIFVLSEVFGIFQDIEIQKVMKINSINTLVDSIHYMNQKKKYGFFFENQIRHTGQVILSKTQNVSKDALNSITADIYAIKPKLNIITKVWSEMTPDAFIGLVDAIEDVSAMQEAKDTPHYKHQKFSTLSLKSEKTFTQGTLTEKLKQLSSGFYGQVIRAKGFVNGEPKHLEFNYVNGSIDIHETEMDPALEPSSSVCFIGENLNKAALSKAFSGLRVKATPSHSNFSSNTPRRT